MKAIHITRATLASLTLLLLTLYCDTAKKDDIEHSGENIYFAGQLRYMNWRQLQYLSRLSARTSHIALGLMRANASWLTQVCIATTVANHVVSNGGASVDSVNLHI